MQSTTTLETSQQPAAGFEDISKDAPSSTLNNPAMGQLVDEKKESPSSDEAAEERVELGASNNQPGGLMPPHQVYIETPMAPPDMIGIENQMQSISIGMPDNGDESENYDQSLENGSAPIKLFVGQVPKSMNEEDIFPVFNQFGPLKDMAIIRDKHTGLHRGCAFVTYWSEEDAHKAQESLHGQYIFPGARRPAQVKPAEPSVPENKLFIGMLSRKAGEDEIRELFAAFGEIREIYMIRNADGSSKCAAFLRYVEREAAIHAIENLHNNIVMEGAARPLIVKFADNKHQRQQRHLRNIRRQEMLNAMGVAPGYPNYMPHHMPMPPHNGNPPFAMHPPYGAFPGGNTPPPHGSPPAFLYAPHQYPPTQAFGYTDRPDARASNPRPREGPAGANLFVYHLPHDLTDADLATAFNPFGNVVSAKVYVDKFTGESKGFGFVSYDSVISAEAAIEQMNGFQIGTKRLKVQHKRVHSNTNNVPQQHQQYPVPPMVGPPDLSMVK